LNKIYSPRMFGRRVKAFAEICDLKLPGARPAPLTPMPRALADRLARAGSEERELLELMHKLLRLRPELRSQIRYMLSVAGVWNPGLARENRPLAA